MTINYKIVSGILAAGWAYEAYANIRNVKQLSSKVKKLADMVMYQADILDKHKVPHTAFDEIAMREIADQ